VVKQKINPKKKNDNGGVSIHNGWEELYYQAIGEPVGKVSISGPSKTKSFEQPTNTVKSYHITGKRNGPSKEGKGNRTEANTKKIPPGGSKRKAIGL